MGIRFLKITRFENSLYTVRCKKICSRTTAFLLLFYAIFISELYLYQNLSIIEFELRTTQLQPCEVYVFQRLTVAQHIF